MQNVGRERREQGELLEGLADVDVGASEGATADGGVLDHPRARRLALLAVHDDPLLDDADVSGADLAGHQLARERHSGAGARGFCLPALLALLLEDAQPLLRLVADRLLHLGVFGQLGLQVFLLQHHQQTLGPGDDGGGPGHVHEHADLAEEGARVELGVDGLAVARGDGDGAADQPVHGLGLVALGEDVVVG